jgi:hypothetical protein
MSSKIFLVHLILIALIPLTTQATYTGVSAEIYQVNGITGYVTYRVYAEFDNPADQLVAFYGYDTAPLQIHTAGDFFQEINGGPTSVSMNPGGWPFVPDLEWDSFITVGYADNVGNLMNGIGFDYTDFENGNNWTVNDIIGGSIFNLPGDPASFPVGGKVLIAQLTTNGDIDLLLNLQWRDPAQTSFAEEGIVLNIVNAIPGCTDPLALNYNSGATSDDGSCTYLPPSFVDLTWEEHAVDGVLGTSTYRVYANFTNPLDQVTALYGQDVTPLYINTSSTFYQHGLGGFTSNSIDPSFFPANPELEYDSWVTIGAEDGPNATQVLGVNSAPFDAGGNLDINDAVGGAVYVIPDSEPAAFPDVSGRVLLAQLTTDGIVDLKFNLQYRAQDGTNPQEVCLELSFPPLVLGCTDTAADNYDSTANQDDGSCVYAGCTYSDATNYDSMATIDDGSCLFSCLGCTDSTALNYNPSANTDDGSCILPVLGCTDCNSTNYDSTANVDNGSCVATVFGCTDSLAFNYDSSANTDNGGCVAVQPGCMDTTALNYNPLANTDDASCVFPVSGCTDCTATNYDSTANVDDGSCVATVFGCTDSLAFNYDSSANTDNGGCIAVQPGCTDSAEDNYNPYANFDDGSCFSSCPGDFTGEGARNTADVLIFLTFFGVDCP